MDNAINPSSDSYFVYKGQEHLVVVSTNYKLNFDIKILICRDQDPPFEDFKKKYGYKEFDRLFKSYSSGNSASCFNAYVIAHLDKTPVIGMSSKLVCSFQSFDEAPSRLESLIHEAVEDFHVNRLVFLKEFDFKNDELKLKLEKELQDREKIKDLLTEMPCHEFKILNSISPSETVMLNIQVKYKTLASAIGGLRKEIAHLEKRRAKLSLRSASVDFIITEIDEKNNLIKRLEEEGFPNFTLPESRIKI